VLIPNTAYQIAALLLLVVPGIVYTSVRRRLKGPVPEDHDVTVRLMRAISWSVLLDFVYLIAIGPRLVHLATAKPARKGLPSGFATQPREAAWLGLALLVAIPAIVAVFAHVRLRKQLWPFGFRRVSHPTPSAWDIAAQDRSECFVRVRTADGYWVGGEILNHQAFISKYPEPRDIFITIEWKMGADGSFRQRVPGSLGVYVPLEGAQRIAWVAKPEVPAKEKPTSLCLRLIRLAAVLLKMRRAWQSL
jgi:hypothetical protein